jgi:hypothetical protein
MALDRSELWKKCLYLATLHDVMTFEEIWLGV